MNNQKKPLLANFDHSAVFESEIKPLLDQLHELCDKHHVPLFSVVTPQRDLTLVDIENGQAVQGGGLLCAKSTFLGMQHPGVMPALALAQVGSEGGIDLCRLDDLVQSSFATHESCKELIHLIAKQGSLTLEEHVAAQVTH